MDKPKIDDKWLERMMNESGLREAMEAATVKMKTELEKLDLSGIVKCDLGLTVRDADHQELAATGVHHSRRFDHATR